MGGISWIDGAILVATLAVAVGIGLAVGRRAKTASAYLIGERDLPAWAVLLSIVATETSSVTFLSVPGKSFVGDLAFLQLPLGYIVGRVAVALLLLPQYFEGETLTAYEVLGRRFGPRVKQASSLLFLVTRNLADGLRLYLTAVPLQALTGMSLPASIAVMSALTIAYTFVGGMRAVVWTDVVQFFIYVAGGVLALVVAIQGIDGGAASLFTQAHAAGKLRTFDFGFALDRADLFWASALGGAFLTLATHGADQLMVQRYLCARSQKAAAGALIGSGFVVLAQFCLFLLLGLALWAFFHEHPSATPITKGDEAFPRFIVERLSAIPGAVGLILGAIFAVSMSTLSSSLNASAGTAVNDLVKPAFGRGWSDARTLQITKGATLLFGVLQALCGIVGGTLTRSVVDAVLAIASFTTGITLGLFFLARVLPRAHDERSAAIQRRAALAAFVLGLAAMTAVFAFTPLAWPWFALVGSLGTLLLGWGIASIASMR